MKSMLAVCYFIAEKSINDLSDVTGFSRDRININVRDYKCRILQGFDGWFMKGVIPMI